MKLRDLAKKVLPASAKYRLKKLKSRLHWGLGTMPEIDAEADMEFLNSLEIAKDQRKDRKDDGMPDYPNTRPHLAIDFLSGLIRWLAESDFHVMSYADLAYPVKLGTEASEFTRWIAGAQKRNERAVLLQYDVDARPDITTEVLKTHIEYGVTANVMIFRRKIFDWKLKSEGRVVFDEYNLDYKTLEKFQDIGGVIGYHCNSFDLSGGDETKALDIFADDVAQLRKHFDIPIMSMHGGHVTPEGKCNATQPVEKLLKELGLVWVHNGHSVYFHSKWADGSASNPRYRNESSNLLDFLLSTNPGERTRLLLHPQYYNDTSNSKFDFPILHDMEWVKSAKIEVDKGAFDGKKYWSNRYSQSVKSIDSFEKLYHTDKEECPVFINGMSRSGTTLMVSMFDAHPDGAMAYESYPRYLYVPSDDGVLTVEEFIYAYQVLINHDEHEAFRLLNRAPLRNLMKFAAVTSWTGMTTKETGELLRAYLVKHHRVNDALEALKIVAASARFKLRNQNAQFWGTKCQGNYDDYFTLWPKAKLIGIFRNGLDILASQQTKGAFNPDAFKLGKQWKEHHDRFQRYLAANPERTVVPVIYDHLVADPETVMHDLCDQIGMQFHPQMIKQHEKESTLTKQPRGQLSVDRIQQPIDTASIGQWKQILSDEDVTAFLEGCGDTSLFERYKMEWKR